ncbi:MAG: hypothetical protein ABEK17_03220 [Candidatus Aenigmatarchaeota archaeon]
MKKRIFDFFRDKLNTFTFLITSGVLLMSLGIYIMGTEIHPFFGSRMIIVGSGIFYISIIGLVFVID